MHKPARSRRRTTVSVCSFAGHAVRTPLIGQFSILHFSFSFFARSAALCSSIAYLRGRRRVIRVRKKERNDQFQYTHQQHAMIAHTSHHTCHTTHHTARSTHKYVSRLISSLLFSSRIDARLSSLVVLVHREIRVHARRPSTQLSTCSDPRPFLLISISKLDDSVLEVVQRLALPSPPLPGAASAALVKNKGSEWGFRECRCVCVCVCGWRGEIDAEVMTC